jgi:tetratricopeptide (TPR) repeat protein
MVNEHRSTHMEVTSVRTEIIMKIDRWNAHVRIILAAVLLAPPLVLSSQSGAQVDSTKDSQKSQTPVPDPARNTDLGPFGQKMSMETSARLSAKLVPSHEAEDRARKLYEAGNMKEAEKECREAIRLSIRVDGKIWNGSAMQLMGEIYMRYGRYREALEYLKQASNFSGLVVEAELDMAIAYCRLRAYRNALQHYADQMILDHVGENHWVAEDLPGTKSLRSLLASALLARGAEDYSHGNVDGALRCFLEADELAPENLLIENYIGESFYRTNMSEAAFKWYRLIAASSRSDMAKRAAR